MRMGNNGDMSGGAQGSTGPQQQGVQATGSEQTLRMQQAEALLRSQAEAALRLAVSRLCFLSRGSFMMEFQFILLLSIVVDCIVIVIAKRRKYTLLVL